MSIYRLGDKHVHLGESAWVAPNASIIGDVRLGARAHGWSQRVLARALTAPIEAIEWTEADELAAGPAGPLGGGVVTPTAH